jgi:hypothetical protein
LARGRARRFFEEAFNEKRLDRADEFVAPDYLDHIHRFTKSAHEPHVADFSLMKTTCRNVRVARALRQMWQSPLF